MSELDPIDTTANLPEIKLDFSKDEQLRVTSLMLAIRYHEGTIVRDPGMYQQLKMSNAELKPTQAKQVIVQAMLFESYLRGDYTGLIDEAMEEFLEAEIGGDDEPGRKAEASK
jgi:hypothetical protein